MRVLQHARMPLLVAAIALTIAACNRDPVVDDSVITRLPRRPAYTIAPCAFPVFTCPDSGTNVQHVHIMYGSGTTFDLNGRAFIRPTDSSNKSGVPPLYQGAIQPTTATITLYVDSTGLAVPNRSITVSLTAVDSAGAGSDSIFGHFHHGRYSGSGGLPKPTGTLVDTAGNTGSSLVVNTGNGGMVKVTFHAPMISGPIVLQAISANADSARNTIIAGIDGLKPMSNSSVIFLVGDVPQHPSGHWALPGTITALTTLATKLMAETGHDLPVNDVSLRFGGFFDLDTVNYWKLDTLIGHQSHRWGRSADIRSQGTKQDALNPEQRGKLITLWFNLTGRLPVRESDHIHLDWRGAP